MTNRDRFCDGVGETESTARDSAALNSDKEETKWSKNGSTQRWSIPLVRERS